MPCFGKVASDLLVDLRRKMVGSECGKVLPGDDDNHGDNGDDYEVWVVSSTWCTSLVSSWVAFSASFVKKSELAFGEGEALEMVEVRK